MRAWIETFFRHVTPFTVIVAFIVFEAEGIVYSDLFVAAVTASLGALGINAYGVVYTKVRR